MGTFKTSLTSSPLRSLPWPSAQQAGVGACNGQCGLSASFPFRTKALTNPVAKYWPLTAHSRLSSRELPSEEGSHLSHGYTPSAGVAASNYWLMWGIEVQPLCLKWDNNKWLSSFRTSCRIHWGLCCNYIGGSFALCPASFAPSQVPFLKALPHKLRQSNLWDPDSISQCPWSMAAPFLSDPKSPCIPHSYLKIYPKSHHLHGCHSGMSHHDLSSGPFAIWTRL